MGSANGVPVRPQVWRFPPPDGSQYPELHDSHFPAEHSLSTRTNNVGLAFQGGGIRAACECLGMLQALHHLGLLHKVRYISSISGSSWLNAPFCFLPDDYSVDLFLAPGPRGPQQLTCEELQNVPQGSFLEALFHSRPILGLARRIVTHDLVTCNFSCCCPCLSGIYRGLCIKPTRPVRHLRAWSAATAQSYLRPFGLDVEGSVMSTPVGTPGHRSAKETVEPHGGSVLPMRSHGPYPIINASRLDIARGHDSSWTPVEFTPLYSGAATEASHGERHLGGGGVESCCVSCKAPTDLPDGRTAVRPGERVDSTTRRFVSLGDACGTSGSDLYTRPGHSILPCLPDWGIQSAKALGATAMDLWSPADIRSPNNKWAVVADGGITDPTGLLALLRRRVSTVVMQCCDGSDIGELGGEPGKNYWWTAYFGLAEEEVYSAYAYSAETMNLRSKVFHSHAMEPLVSTLVAKATAGEPVFAETVLDVLENRHAGVKGGWKVTILWCYPSISKPFKDALPDETRQLLQRDPPSGCCASFANSASLVCGGTACDLSKEVPYVPSTLGNYTAPLSRMLAEATAHTLLHGVGKKRLEALILTR